MVDAYRYFEREHSRGKVVIALGQKNKNQKEVMPARICESCIGETH